MDIGDLTKAAHGTGENFHVARKQKSPDLQSSGTVSLMTYGAPKSILSGTTGVKSGKKKKVKLPKKLYKDEKVVIRDNRTPTPLDVDYEDELAFAIPK